MLFLVLALAAQARSSGSTDQKLAQHYFYHGRQSAVLHLTDEPVLETVQAFSVTHLYLLACSRRNAAFLSLGIAISAAKALGFHRIDQNAHPNDQKTKERCAFFAVRNSFFHLTFW